MQTHKRHRQPRPNARGVNPGTAAEKPPPVPRGFCAEIKAQPKRSEIMQQQHLGGLFPCGVKGSVCFQHNSYQMFCTEPSIVETVLKGPQEDISFVTSRGIKLRHYPFVLYRII